MKIIEGDLIELAKRGEFDVIIHGCNCFCTMGAGIAKQIKDNFPAAYQADLDTDYGGRKLGSTSFANIDTSHKSGSSTSHNTLYVVNAYTQFHLGASFNEVALVRCLKWVANHFQGYRIGYPRIGCGIGGGDWELVSKIFDRELDGMNHTLVEYVPMEKQNAD